MSVLLVASLLSTVYIFETNRLYEGGNHKYMLAPGAFLISFTIFAMILLVLFIIFKLTNKHNIHYNNNFFCQGIKKLGIFFDIFMYVNSIGSLVLTLCALIRSTGSTNIIFIILVIIF
ncbi:hypothetical protein FACS189496_5470 [Bacilli bacterium]|nr:hypothetical protein FACS189496_5470 [Bacilli bacterium]